MVNKQLLRFVPRLSLSSSPPPTSFVGFSCLLFLPPFFLRTLRFSHGLCQRAPSSCSSSVGSPSTQLFSSLVSLFLLNRCTMASDKPSPDDRTTPAPVSIYTFSNFLQDVHHAYLLLHRAFQLIPPTIVPNLEPMPRPGS